MTTQAEVVALTQYPAQETLMRPIATPKELMSYHQDMTVIIREALREGTDYGVIPGTKKPTLYKPGAERINIAFGTHPEYELVEKEIDHDRENKTKFGVSYGLYRYVYKCRIVKSDGRVIGEGHGVCSTLESKYVSRPRDSENTALKMAQKRAFLAATLHAYGLSDRFTQDLEDQHGAVEETKAPSAQLLFNSNDIKHIEGLERKLKEMKLEVDVDAVATRFNGKPFTADSLKAILKELTTVTMCGAGNEA